jgi:hypothetical protein
VSGELRSLSLEAAIVGAAALRRVDRVLPGLPALTRPALPSLLQPGQLFGRALDHVASTFRRRPSGIYVPAAPALIGHAWPPPADASGPDAGRTRPRPGVWAEALELDGLATFLRARHPTKTAQHVAALTGESQETVRKWLRLETRPGLRATIILVCVYELPLIEACLRRHPDWLARAREDSGRHAIAAELASLRPRIDAALGPSCGGAS